MTDNDEFREQHRKLNYRTGRAFASLAAIGWALFAVELFHDRSQDGWLGIVLLGLVGALIVAIGLLAVFQYRGNGDYEEWERIVKRLENERKTND